MAANYSAGQLAGQAGGQLAGQSGGNPFAGNRLAGNRLAGREPDGIQSEPVIHVSIGRIEVRATAPQSATPPRRAAKPLPAQKLADYLRERSEGRR